MINAHVQRAVTSIWKNDTCQICLLVNHRLNCRWNSAGLNKMMISDAWSEGLVVGEYSNGGGQYRRWQVTAEIHKQCLQKAAACALTSQRLSSHPGFDFNIPLQWPSIKHRPILLSTLLKLHCCHLSQDGPQIFSQWRPLCPYLLQKWRTPFQMLETLRHVAALKFTHYSHSSLPCQVASNTHTLHLLLKQTEQETQKLLR